MRTVERLRLLVRQELVAEARRAPARKARRTSTHRSLTTVITRYPRIVALSKEQEPGHYGTWDSVVTSRNPELELEKLAVYRTMADSGPDVSYVRVGKLLPRIRRAAGRKGILAAFESNGLSDVLDGLGLLDARDAEARTGSDTYF